MKHAWIRRFSSRHQTGSVLAAVMVLAMTTVVWSRGSRLSDDDLSEMGYAAYQSRNWVDAATALFAYLQRSPAAVAADPSHGEEVQRAYTHARERIAEAITQRDQLMGSTREPSSGLGSRTSGLGVQPPPLGRRSASSNSGAAKRCGAYARVALAQNEANRSSGCGYQGNRWSPDYDLHYNWCLAVAGENARSETSERQRLLDQCAP